MKVLRKAALVHSLGLETAAASLRSYLQVRPFALVSDRCRIKWTLNGWR